MTTYTIEIPNGITIGDLLTVKGALLDASTTFVDWEALHSGRSDAVSAPGSVLLAIASTIAPKE